MSKSNEVKLGYEPKNMRYRKMVNGKQWVSSRGLLNTNADRNKAIAEFLEWQKNQTKSTVDHDVIQTGPFAGLAAMTIAGSSFAYGDPEKNPPHLNPDDPIKLAYEAGVAAEVRRTGKKTLATLADDFVAFKIGRVCEDEQKRLGFAMAWFKEVVWNAPTMTPDVWDSVDKALRLKMSSGVWTANYAQSRQNAIRMFFNWLFETEKISEKPRYVYAKIYNVAVPAKLPEFFTKEEIKAIMDLATPMQKLHYSLMLGCSMTAADLSELTWEMIDLKAGTLTRKRTKHEDKESDRIPTVVYTLWPSVRDSLKSLGGKTGRVFSNDAGKPLVNANRNDAVQLAFNRIKTKLNLNKSVKHFRKTGVSFMAKEHRAWREVFLANTLKDVTDRSYDGTTVLPAEVTEHIRLELGL